MTRPNVSDPAEAPVSDSSFGDILTEFEQAHHAGGQTVEGTVVSITPDGAFVDDLEATERAERICELGVEPAP